MIASQKKKQNPKLVSAMKNLEKAHLIDSTEKEKPLYHNSGQLTYDSCALDSVGGATQINGYLHSHNASVTESINISEEQRILYSDPEIEEQKGRIGSISAFIHIIRCHMGSGLLGAARAVNYAGLAVGFVLFIVSGLLVLGGMHLVLSCASRLGKRLQTDHTSWTYQDIVEKTFVYGSPRVRKFAGLGRAAAITSSALLQFGSCSFYFVVVCDAVHQLMEDFFHIDLDVRVYMVAMLVLLVPQALVKRLDILVVFSSIANVLFSGCLLIAIGYLAADLPPISERLAFSSIGGIPMFMGQALASLEGIAVIIPIQNKMKKPEQFARPLGVLNLGMAFIIFFITAIGCLGYWKYGENTATNVLLNLPQDEWLCVAAKIMLPIVIVLSYPIQFYFIFVMIWQPVADRITSPWLLRNGEYIQRLITLVLTFVCAVCVPHLDLLLALFGSVCATVLGFIIPGFTDIASHTSEGERITVLQLVRDIFLITVGVFFFFLGSYFALKDIVAGF